MLNQIIQGDCYELMKGIPDGSIDLVLTDPPYNTTACDWDQQPIDLPLLWENIKRVLKPKGAVVMTGSQPFTTDLIMSNRKWFKYEIIWDKVNRFTGFLDAKRKPLKQHETILVFYNAKPTYTPQMGNGKPYVAKRSGSTDVYQTYTVTDGINNGERYPTSILRIESDNKTENGMHPTQKPVALFDYLIRTYTNPGETVLDPFAGSGTTALAAHATGRQFLCFEKEQKYWEIANKRLALAQMQGRFEEMVG